MRAAGAIVVGGYVNGLGVVRALAAQGIPVAVVTTKPYDIAHRSHWVCAHHALTDLDDQPDRLAELLERRAAAWAGWAIVPTNDGAVAAIAKHWDRLSATYRLVSPSPETTPYLLDKEQMLGVARAVGIDTPVCYGRAGNAVAQTALHYPVLVKPIVGYRFFSRFGCKLFVAHTRDELARSIERLTEAGLTAQLFDLIPGPDSEIYAYCTYVDARGDAHTGLTVRKLRQSPPFFGVARAAELVDDIPLLRDAARALLQRMQFRGMAAVEFKRDPRDGRFRFFEVNGRSVIYNGLLRRGGLDLTALAWGDYVDGHVPDLRPNGWGGVWVNAHADLLYSLLHRRDAPVSVGELVATYRREKIEAVWSSNDPRPFVTQWSRTARQGMATLWRGTHQDLVTDRRAPTNDAAFNPSRSAA